MTESLKSNMVLSDKFNSENSNWRTITGNTVGNSAFCIWVFPVKAGRLINYTLGEQIEDGNNMQGSE